MVAEHVKWWVSDAAAAISQDTGHSSDHRSDQDDEPDNYDHGTLGNLRCRPILKDRGIGRLHRFPGGRKPVRIGGPAGTGPSTGKKVLAPARSIPQIARGCSCRGPEQRHYITLPLTLAHRAGLPPSGADAPGQRRHPASLPGRLRTPRHRPELGSTIVLRRPGVSGLTIRSFSWTAATSAAAALFLFSARAVAAAGADRRVSRRVQRATARQQRQQQQAEDTGQDEDDTHDETIQAVRRTCGGGEPQDRASRDQEDARPGAHRDPAAWSGHRPAPSGDLLATVLVRSFRQSLRPIRGTGGQPISGGSGIAADTRYLLAGQAMTAYMQKSPGPAASPRGIAAAAAWVRSNVPTLRPSAHGRKICCPAGPARSKQPALWSIAS